MWLDASVGKEKLPVGNFMFSVLMRPDIRPGLALFFEQMGQLTQVVLVAQRVFALQGFVGQPAVMHEHAPELQQQPQ